MEKIKAAEPLKATCFILISRIKFRIFRTMNPQLNLPQVSLKMKSDQVWDRLRKRYVPFTSEEWVRQHFISYLIDHLGYPEGRMASEFTVAYNGMKKRCDIVCFNSDL